MDQITRLDKFIAPYGNQEIELQQVDFEAGGMSLLRIRIRERGARFTIFDIDAGTAQRWGQVLQSWAQAQLQTGAQEKNNDG